MQFRPDVVQLREFYTTPLGRLVRRYLGRAVRLHWPELKHDAICGIGYANPVLRGYLPASRDEERVEVINLMPASQGALVWPDHTANRSVLADETRLPFGDHQLNRVLLIHVLEHAPDPQALLRECWRVLVPGGHLIAVVPNRHSLWSSAMQTPFAEGKPYRAGQLKSQLCTQLFTHIHTSHALFFLPTQKRWLLKLTANISRLTQWLLPQVGGVIIMEVEKQLYAGLKQPLDWLKDPLKLRVAGNPALSRQR